MSRSIQLYRSLIATASEIPVLPVQRKLKYNIRELFDLYKPVQSSDEIADLHKDAEAAIEIIKWLKHLPEVPADHLNLVARHSALHKFAPYDTETEEA